ncbi:hypothetical protein C0J52_15024 [Blattella germanica]|nr:hypothetical protein C0J52_15024 [Blattella germanica]
MKLIALLSTNKKIAECSCTFLNLKLFGLNLKLFILKLKVFSLNLKLFGLNLKLFIPNFKYSTTSQFCDKIDYYLNMNVNFYFG